jgi:hypothetical protein
MEEGGQEEGVGVAIGGTHICLAEEGDGLVELYASCDHEVERRPAWEMVASRFELPT